MLDMKIKLFIACVMMLSLFLSSCSSENKLEILDAENPVSITVWHYYNAEQQKAFDEMVKNFNDTQGLEEGIIVETHAYGDVVDLQQAVLYAINKKVGAEEVPNIFSAYADTAYAIDKLGYAVDVSKYMTKEELSKYINGYMEEGRFGKEGQVKIFPIAKATEVLSVNKTDWEKFSASTGTTVESLATIEGITKVAEEYYNWTDTLTPQVKNDGKAFFGRDAIANYLIIGSKQLGQEIFASEEGQTVFTFDEDIIKKLWDNYYIPYVKGYFAASGRYRSGDVKTGDIIAYVGSTASATYFPSEVIVNDQESYPIEVACYPSPKFANGQNYAIQQGAGMVVTNENEIKTYAAMIFLKWFTAKERNLKFTLDAGYLPVTYDAYDPEYFRKAMKENADSENLQEFAEVAMETVSNNELYTTKVFQKADDARKILESSMSNKAVEDRAKVVEKLNRGVVLKNAVSEYTSDENFKKWYIEVKNELEQCVK